MDIDKLQSKYSLTLDKYITNPTENKGNLFLNLAMVKQGLGASYEKLKTNPLFKLNVFNYKEGLLIHVAVPSEKYDLWYDVLLQLIDYKEEDKPVDDKSLKNIKFLTYSNCPSFVFTYAYVFNKRNLLIADTISKYEKEIFNRPPYQRNYYNIVNIEKSLYFAIRFVLENYSTIGSLQAIANSLPIGFWNNITKPQDKINEYNRVKKEYHDNIEKEEKAKVRKEAVKRVVTGKSQDGDTKRIITGKDHRKSKIKGKAKRR
jgi:hypothetical protein